jgi:cytochrome c553
MRRWLRAGVVAAAVGFLIVSAAGGALLWAGSRQLAHDHGALPERVAGGPGDAELGARLVSIYGCTGCHGPTLTGGDFYGVVAPNLRHRAREWGHEGFARAVRRGLRPDGTSTTWAMPSEFFAAMADNELAAIYAHLLRLPAAKDAEPASLRHRLFKAFAAVTGELMPNAVLVRPTDTGPVVAPAPGTPEWGPYFTRLACGECHNHGLGGNPGWTPALSDAVQVYDWPAFKVLTSTGRPPDGRRLRLMTEVGAKRLAAMTDIERRALFDYLKGLPPP